VGDKRQPPDAQKRKTRSLKSNEVARKKGGSIARLAGERELLPFSNVKRDFLKIP